MCRMLKILWEITHIQLLDTDKHPQISNYSTGDMQNIQHRRGLQLARTKLQASDQSEP
jgi:hypothetical protein